MVNKILLDPITKRFIQVKEPPKEVVAEKPPEIVLTEDDKKRVIAEFIAIFDREPDQSEAETLFEEELAILATARSET